jgi:hypothetical protein
MENMVEIENVEQLGMMENKFGIRLDGVYAEYQVSDEYRYISVHGEIQGANKTKIAEDRDLVFWHIIPREKLLQLLLKFFCTRFFLFCLRLNLVHRLLKNQQKLRFTLKNYR